MDTRLRHVAGCVVALLVPFQLVRTSRIATNIALLAVGTALLALPAFAQFGHPLKGTWSGDWGPTKDKQTHVVLEFHWDGKAITGRINPGPKGVPFQKATLDAPNWTVHIEAEGKDASGTSIRYVIDGKIENIGSYNRVMSGTYALFVGGSQGAEKGTFRVVRN
jgi:hypothetical protein